MTFVCKRKATEVLKSRGRLYFTLQKVTFEASNVFDASNLGCKTLYHSGEVLRASKGAPSDVVMLCIWMRC